MRELWIVALCSAIPFQSANAGSVRTYSAPAAPMAAPAPRVVYPSGGYALPSAPQPYRSYRTYGGTTYQQPTYVPGGRAPIQTMPRPTFSPSYGARTNSVEAPTTVRRFSSGFGASERSPVMSRAPAPDEVGAPPTPGSGRLQFAPIGKSASGVAAPAPGLATTTYAPSAAPTLPYSTSEMAPVVPTSRQPQPAAAGAALAAPNLSYSTSVNAPVIPGPSTQSSSGNLPVVPGQSTWANAPVVPHSGTPSVSAPLNIAPNYQNSASTQPTYTFSQTGNGTVQVFQNGRLVSTTTTQNAAMTYGYGAASNANSGPAQATAGYTSTPAQQSAYQAPSTPIGAPAAGPTYAPGGHAIIPTVPQTGVSTASQALPSTVSGATQYFTTPSGAVMNAATGQLVSPPPTNWSAPSNSSASVNILPAVNQQSSPIAASASNSVQSIPLSALPVTGLFPGQAGAGTPSGLPKTGALPPVGSSGIANSTPMVSPQSKTTVSSPAVIVHGITTTPLSITVPTAYASNCVLFLRDYLKVQLPNSDLTSMAQKESIVNVPPSNAPKVGDVAIISVTNPTDAEYGHMAIVTAVTPNSITIEEANYSFGKVDMRTSSAISVQQAAASLNIVGYFQPGGQAY